ncbi:hypothetical protein QN277_012433 [Acacia crassicarpa]|nr:hypothetical protein QN277_012433 [Acacia crassicarpa]
MASQKSVAENAKHRVTVTSPKSDNNGGAASPSSKGQCLCSPTTHPGSFRCRFHRSSSMKRQSSILPAAVHNSHQPTTS